MEVDREQFSIHVSTVLKTYSVSYMSPCRSDSLTDANNFSGILIDDKFHFLHQFLYVHFYAYI